MSKFIIIDPKARTVSFGERADLARVCDSWSQRSSDSAAINRCDRVYVDDCGLARVGQHYFIVSGCPVLFGGNAFIALAFGDSHAPPSVTLEEIASRIIWRGQIADPFTAAQALQRGVGAHSSSAR